MNTYELEEDLILNGVHYCPYCGQPMLKNNAWDHYDEDIWYTCNCETRKLAAASINEANAAIRKIIKPLYHIKTTLSIDKI